MQEQSGASDEEMYGNFNMGAGFAIFVPAEQAASVIKTAEAQGLKAWNAGLVKDGPKQVTIVPKNITFGGDSLEVR